MLLAAVATFCLVLPPPARAFVAGSWVHAPLSTHKIFGNAKPIGNTLMLPGPAGAEIRSILLANSSSALTGLPADAVIEKAYLFWSGSLAQQGVSGPTVADPSVTFSVANGASFNVNGTCTTVTHPTLGTTFPSFFYCRSDVTSQVANNKLAGTYNGLYIVGDVTADPGHVDPITGDCTETPNRCQAKYAAWSLVVIYSSASETLQRDIHLYDGFRIVDHEDGPGGSIGVTNFTISGFLADSTPQGTLSYFAVETDAQLGIPPQNLSPPPMTCTTCEDYVKFNGTTLQDSLGWPGNIFNESAGNGYGVDIDEIEIGSLLSPGATSATIEIGSGTGPVVTPAPPHGGGELYGFGWTLLSLRRPSPNFKTAATNKSVNPTTAGQGETVAYSVNIANAGSLAATGTVVTDSIPALVDYKPGSLQVNGSPCTDAADGDACTVSGKQITVSLGTVGYLVPNNSRQITFLGTVSASAANGQLVCNSAAVTSDQTPTPFSTNQACFTVKAPELDTPTKVALDLDGGLVEPEDFVQFTVTIPKKSTGQVTGLTLDDDIPANMNLLSVNGPPGATVTSSTNGGQHGRGFIKVSDITIPAGVSSVNVVFTVRIDSESELIASGVPAANIDGLQLCNQGEVSALFLTAALSTDDPAAAGSANPTCLTLTYAPKLGTSLKSVLDVNGGKLEPGDTLRYTVTFTNTGNREATLDVQDDLPPNVTGFAWVQQLPGATFTPGGGANGTGRISIAGLKVQPEKAGPPPEAQTMVFEVTVAPGAPNGAAIQNCASFDVAEKPSEGKTICSASLSVYATPDLEDAQKTVLDLNGGQPQPGDALRYTVTLSNTGNKPATGVVVTDVVSTSLENVVPLDGGAWDAATRTITWTVGSLAAGAQQALRFEADIVTPLPNGTALCNQGSVASNELPAEPTDNPATPAADDPTCLSVVSAPELEQTTKTVVDLNGGQVRPGDTLRYTITVDNSGNEIATNVLVTDQVSADLTNVQPLDGGTLSGSTISWSLGSLAPGQQKTVRFEADVVTPLVNGTQISNQAVATATQIPLPGEPSDDPSTPAPDDPTVVTVTSAADLTTSEKTVQDVNGGVPQPGDQLVYTIRVINTGDAPARGTVVTDLVDLNLTTVVPLDGGAYNAATRTITWPGADVVPGTDRVLRFNATLAFPMTGGTQVCNQGSVTSQDVSGTLLTDDPATAAADDPTCVTVESEPDLAPSTKTVTDLNGGQVVPGDVLRYTITVDNQGTQDATTVVVTDVVSTSLTAVTPLDGGVYDAASRTITWTVATAPAKGKVAVRFDAQVILPLDSGTQIANQGSIVSAEITTPVLTDDPATPATDDPTVVTVTSTPDFGTSQKSVLDVNGGLVEPGDTLTYTLTVVNSGTSLADNVVVTDLLDQSIDFVSAGQGGSYNAATRTLTWNGSTTPALAQLGLGQAAAVTLTFSAKVASPLNNGTQICNQGQLGSDEVAVPVPTDNPQTPAPGDPTCVTVFSAPDLSGVTKTVTDLNGAPVRPGDTLTWSITLTNTGNSAATGVVVTDPVDASLESVVPGQGGVFNPLTRVISWNGSTTPALASLDAGASLVLSFSAVVVKPLDGGTLISNQATVSSPTLPTPVLTDDPTTPTIDDPTVVTVVAAADLGASQKSVLDPNGGDVEPGDALTWTITLKNTGDALAKNVTVTDVVDQNLDTVVPLDGGVYNPTTRTISWSVAQVGLSPAGDVTLRFNATVVTPLKNGTVIANQAQIQLGSGVSVPTDDPGTPAPDDPTQVTVVSKPDLSGMTKTVAGTQPGKKAGPGTTLTYSIVIPNAGSEDAQNVLVSDVVDQNLENVVPLDGGTYSAATRTITWVVPLVSAGGQVTVRFSATIRADAKNNAKISNQAVAAVPGVPGQTVSDDPDTPQVDDPTVVTVEAIANLTDFTKTVKDLNGGDVEPGDTLEYTLIVRNSGTAYAFNVKVTDVVQLKDLENIQIGQGGWFNSANNTITWDASTTPALAKLAPGAQTTLTFTARVRVPTANGTQIFNQAVVRADDVFPEPSDDPATPQNNDPTRVKVLSVPRLGESTKAVTDLNGGLVKPGDILEYTIKIVNSGTAVATSTTLLDPIPTYTTYVPNSTRLNGVSIADVAGGSTVAHGMQVNSPGMPTGQVTVGASSAAEVRFRVRVELDTPQGRIVSNQGLVSAQDSPVEPTDDLATPAKDDPTQVVVGAGPNLNNTQKTFAAKPIGDNGNNAFDVGEVIAYTVLIPNTGTVKATGVVFTDPLDASGRGTYVGGSMTLDGKPLTDGADGDAGAAKGNSLRVVVGTISAGATATITYRVRIASGPLVSNQGTVRSTELQPELTDADGNDANGDTPTVVPVAGAASRRLRGSKAVLDLNGGDVQPGDELLYTVTVFNDGNGTESADIIDDLPRGTSYLGGSLVAPPGATRRFDPPPAGQGQGQVSSTVPLKAGESATIIFRVRLDANLQSGDSVCNTARLGGGGGLDVQPPIEPACVLVGSPAGTGGLSGVVFRDLGQDNRVLDEKDQTLSGFQVQAYATGNPNATPIASAVSDGEGRYRLGSLPPGVYTLRALSASGVQMGALAALSVKAGAAASRDVPVDPSGVIYDSVTGKVISGARVTLYYDSTDPASPGALVPTSLLGPGQQGQTTDASGFYRFDVQRDRRYEVKVDPLTPSLQFPSALIPATAGFAQVGADDEVVPEDLPDPKKEGADLTYFLRFNIDEKTEAVFNNHIPLDPITSLIRLEKRIDRRRASMGDLATYTITVQNRSTRDFSAKGERVVIEDVLPRGLRFLRDTTRLVRRVGKDRACTQDEITTRDVDGSRVCLSRQEPSAGSTGRVLRFGPFPLGPGEAVRLVYQSAVGLDTKQGSYRNRAVLRDEPLSTTLSNADEAVLLVEPDPDLDQGLLIGRVFCDNDGDGRPGRGDRGIAGARVYLDNGTYSVTDASGKYHLRDIDPGLHLVKVDANTLPVSSRLTTDVSRVVQFTRGLPAKVDFGATCRENWVKVQQVKLKPKKKPKKKKTAPKKKLAVPGITLAGDAVALRVSADGQPVPTLDVDLALTRAGGDEGLPADWNDLPAPGLRLRGDQLAPPLVLHLKAEGRSVRGWRLTIVRVTEGGSSVVVRRFSGSGRPPAQLLWDGRLAGKTVLEPGALYEARLEAVGFEESGGAAPPRRFAVGWKGAPAAPPRGGTPSAYLDGNRLALDARGRFATTVGRTEERAPLLELRRGDGKATWVALGETVPAEEEEPPERIKVEGSLVTPRLVVDNQPVDVSLLRAGLSVKGDGTLPALDRRGRLKDPVELGLIGGTSLVRRWHLRITRAGERRAGVVRTARGAGKPPALWAWDGLDDGGQPAVQPGAVYVARLTVEDERGNRGGSAPLELRAPPAVAFGGLKVERPRLFSPRGGALVGAGRGAMRRALGLLARRPKSERYRLTARVAPPAGWDSSRSSGLTQQVTQALIKLLEQRGLDPARFELTVGALPAPDKATARRQESLVLDVVPPTPVTPTSYAPRVLVDGEAVPVADDGSFSTWAKVTLGAALVIDLRDSSGRRAVLVVPTRPKAKIPVSSLREQRATRVASAGGEGSGVFTLRMRDGQTLVAQAPGQPAASQPAAPAASQPAAPAASQPAAPAPPPPLSSLGPRQAAGQERRAAPFGSDELREAFGLSPPGEIKKSARPRDARRVEAARLEVDLPPRGAVLRAHELSLRGRTHPGNTVTVNGEKVTPEPDGTFSHVVKLPDGRSELTIEALDRAGNRGTIRWPVEVSDRALFLMAMAEGAIGQVGAELDGDTEHTRLEAGPVMLHGRTVLYLKGRIKGKYLFKDYFVTAHVDSAKQREFGEFFDQVVDPNRYYPIYGDSSQQVRDVNARDKYYLLVKADQSSLLVGNFRAGVKGIELLSYDRVLYGVKLDLDKKLFKGKLRQQAKVFASYDDARLARDHNILRATGGSIYYLRHGQVLEGSERVQLVVRERDTGLVLASLPKSRDLDYVIDYPGGRILFKAPVSAVADASFSVNNPAFTLSTLAGHPVYLEVDYEYEAEGEGGAGSWGVQVKDTLFDVLTVGGTYVSESRNADVGGDYRLYGAEMTLRHGKASQLTFEFARSESYDAQNYLSEDGGVTYLGMNHIAQLSADERAGDSNAYKVAASLELSDFVKSVKPELLRGQGYYSKQDRGFYSGGTILDQGRTKYGGRIEWAVTDRDKLVLRHDGAVALLPQIPLAGSTANLDPLMMREIETELTRLQYQLRRGRLGLQAEYAHHYLRDPATAAYQQDPTGTPGLDSNRDTVGLLASYQVHKRVKLLLGQDAMLHVTGTDPQLGTGAVGLSVQDTGDWRDRLMTSAGVALSLTKTLEAQLTESVRWSGDNATALGFKAKISETASMYVRQILGNQEDRFSTTSVVGAEDRFGEKQAGRTYGEYQLQSGILGLNNRAILGLDHKWTPWRGISFAGGYEHQQVFGGSLPDGTPTGDSQRDVTHVGFEYIRPRTLKLSTRAELRYDNGAGVAGLGPGTQGQVTAANVDSRAGLGQGHYGDRIVLPGTQLLLTPGERWQVVTRTAASWAATRDLTLLARVNYYYTYNKTNDRVEAEALELGLGAALRPIEWDWLNVLFKYTRVMEMRPISFTDNMSRYRTYDVVSVAPILELPWQLQLVEKLAYKRIDESLDLLPGETLDTVIHTLLWINRINFHITGKLDAGVEYRFLKMMFDNQGGQLRHGALLELGYWVHRFVRLGAGYNFSSFTDDEFSDQSRDAKGFFFRVVGRY